MHSNPVYYIYKFIGVLTAAYGLYLLSSALYFTYLSYSINDAFNSFVLYLAIPGVVIIGASLITIYRPTRVNIKLYLASCLLFIVYGPLFNGVSLLMPEPPDDSSLALQYAVWSLVSVIILIIVYLVSTIFLIRRVISKDKL